MRWAPVSGRWARARAGGLVRGRAQAHPPGPRRRWRAPELARGVGRRELVRGRGPGSRASSRRCPGRRGAWGRRRRARGGAGSVRGRQRRHGWDGGGGGGSLVRLEDRGLLRPRERGALPGSGSSVAAQERGNRSGRTLLGREWSVKSGRSVLISTSASQAFVTRGVDATGAVNARRTRPATLNMRGDGVPENGTLYCVQHVAVRMPICTDRELTTGSARCGPRSLRGGEQGSMTGQRLVEGGAASSSDHCAGAPAKIHARSLATRRGSSSVGAL